MQKKERFTARKLAIVGLLSALVFVSSWMQIEVGPARFHLGNGFLCAGGPSVRPAYGRPCRGVWQHAVRFDKPGLYLRLPYHLCHQNLSLVIWLGWLPTRGQ